MKSPNFFIIEAKETHKTQEGSIMIDINFENQTKVKQFHPIIAVPNRFKDIVDVGDMLCIHFNSLRFEKDQNNITKTKNHIKDDYYAIPPSEAHFVIKKDGSYVFFQKECIIEGKLGEEDRITDAGLHLVDTRNEFDKKKDLLKGVVWKTNSDIPDIEEGDRVVLSPHSDYQIEFPDGVVRWLVRYSYMLYKEV
jgi:hypothetical protein